MRRMPDWCNCNGLAITQRVTSWLIISTDNSTRGSETHEREKIILNRIITNIFAKRINCSIEGNIEKCKRGKFHHAFDKKKKERTSKETRSRRRRLPTAIWTFSKWWDVLLEARSLKSKKRGRKKGVVHVHHQQWGRGKWPCNTGRYRLAHRASARTRCPNFQDTKERYPHSHARRREQPSFSFLDREHRWREREREREYRGKRSPASLFDLSQAPGAESLSFVIITRPSTGKRSSFGKGEGS